MRYRMADPPRPKPNSLEYPIPRKTVRQESGSTERAPTGLIQTVKPV
jgi:hypothetical protein